jgi:hypothetical protein
VVKSTIWSGGAWRATKPVRCPACGDAPERYVEFGTATMSFDARPGLRAEEGFHMAGDVERVEAICGCGHRWKLRGVRQIIDLDLP